MNDDFNKGAEAVLNVVTRIVELGGEIHNRQICVALRDYLLNQPDMSHSEYEEQTLNNIMKDMGASFV